LIRRENVFPKNSESECSAYPSGLLTYIVPPCTSSHLASRCQLAPPAPSPLARELTPRRRCAPRRSLRVPPPPPPCSCHHPRTAPAAAAVTLASPIPRRPRECRRRRRRSWCVPRVFPPPARPSPPPSSPLPRLLQSDDRAGIGHRHLPCHQVRSLLTTVCRALPTARGRPRALIFISSSPPPRTEACQIIKLIYLL
jgi:hypothetical protein